MQVLAAFDAFVPGTPLWLNPQQGHRGCVDAAVAGGDDAAAQSAVPFSHVVMMPPAPVMIGTSASTSWGLSSVSITRSIWPAASMQ